MAQEQDIFQKYGISISELMSLDTQQEAWVDAITTMRNLHKRIKDMSPTKSNQTAINYRKSVKHDSNNPSPAYLKARAIYDALEAQFEEISNDPEVCHHLASMLGTVEDTLTNLIEYRLGKDENIESIQLMTKKNLAKDYSNLRELLMSIAKGFKIEHTKETIPALPGNFSDEDTILSLKAKVYSFRWTITITNPVEDSETPDTYDETFDPGTDFWTLARYFGFKPFEPGNFMQIGQFVDFIENAYDCNLANLRLEDSGAAITLKPVGSAFSHHPVITLEVI